MIEAQIGAALKARLAAIPVDIEIAWPNRDYSPNGTRFLAADIIPSPKERIGVAAIHRTAGQLSIIVATQMNNGSGEGNGVADAIAAHFPADLRLPLSGGGAVRITGEASMRQGFADAGYWRTPVLVPYEVLR